MSDEGVCIVCKGRGIVCTDPPWFRGSRQQYCCPCACQGEVATLLWEERWAGAARRARSREEDK